MNCVCVCVARMNGKQLIELVKNCLFFIFFLFLWFYSLIAKDVLLWPFLLCWSYSFGLFMRRFGLNGWIHFRGGLSSSAMNTYNAKHYSAESSLRWIYKILVHFLLLLLLVSDSCDDDRLTDFFILFFFSNSKRNYAQWRYEEFVYEKQICWRANQLEWLGSIITNFRLIFIWFWRFFEK